MTRSPFPSTSRTPGHRIPLDPPLRWPGCIAALGLLLGTTIAVQAADTPAESKAAAAKSSSAEETQPRYTTGRKHPFEGGSGKYYLGREIAMVMSFHGAPWLERPEREQEEELSRLIKALKMKPGMVVADIGAGSGVISGMIAPALEPGGKVLAVDIQPEMLARLKRRMKERKISNVEPVLSTVKSPKLKENSVDLAIMVDVYHEFSYPYEMMVELSKAIKPGGRIAFVEYRMEDASVPIKRLHKMSEKQVKKEITQPEFGLAWKETLDVLPRQHIVIFERKKPEDE